MINIKKYITIVILAIILLANSSHVLAQGLSSAFSESSKLKDMAGAG